MAYKITNACTACGACCSECPVGAIFEGSPIWEIERSTCTDCGNCVPKCPQNAIQPDEPPLP